MQMSYLMLFRWMCLTLLQNNSMRPAHQLQETLSNKVPEAPPALPAAKGRSVLFLHSGEEIALLLSQLKQLGVYELLNIHASALSPGKLEAGDVVVNCFKPVTPVAVALESPPDVLDIDLRELLMMHATHEARSQSLGCTIHLKELESAVYEHICADRHGRRGGKCRHTANLTPVAE